MDLNDIFSLRNEVNASLEQSAFYEKNIILDKGSKNGSFIIYDDSRNIDDGIGDYTEFRKQIYTNLFKKLEEYLFSNYGRKLVCNNIDTGIEELLNHNFVVTLNDAKNWEIYIKSIKLKQNFLNKCNNSKPAGKVYDQFMYTPFINIDYNLKLKIKIEISICEKSDYSEISINISNINDASKEVINDILKRMVCLKVSYNFKVIGTEGSLVYLDNSKLVMQ